MDNISIKKATSKEIKRFNRKEWKKQDAEHYGRSIRWIEKDFIFKAVEKGKIVGCAKFKYESGVVYVKNVIIAENKRGKGIGQKLMERAEEFSKK